MDSKFEPTRLEDGRIVSVTPEGVFEFVDGEWTKPSRPVSAEDHFNSRPLSNEEVSKLLKSGTSD